MQAKVIAGKVGPLPVRGGYASIDNADVDVITSAAGGMARALAKGVGSGLGSGIKLAVGLAGAYALVKAMSQSVKIRSAIPALRQVGIDDPVRIPITALATIVTDEMNGYGVCLTDAIIVGINGIISIPTEYIANIEVTRRNDDNSSYVLIETVSGMRYRFASWALHTTKLRFMTPVGMEHIDITSMSTIDGLTEFNVDQLRARLRKVAEEQANILQKLAETKEVGHYFTVEPSSGEMQVARQTPRTMRSLNLPMRVWVRCHTWQRHFREWVRLNPFTFIFGSIPFGFAGMGVLVILAAMFTSR